MGAFHPLSGLGSVYQLPRATMVFWCYHCKQHVSKGKPRRCPSKLSCEPCLAPIPERSVGKIKAGVCGRCNLNASKTKASTQLPDTHVDPPSENNSDAQSSPLGKRIEAHLLEPAPKKPRGKPPKYSLEHRIDLVTACIHFGVSHRKAGETVSHFLKSDPPAPVASLGTVQRSLIALLCLEYEIATLLANSTSLMMAIDGSSTGMQRKFTEIEFSGLTKDGVWCHVVSLAEMKDGGAEAEMDLILRTIGHYRYLQTELDLSNLVDLCSFDSIVFDNTASNTGAINGLGQRIRNEQNLLRGTPGIFLAKGCDDHVASLIAKHFRKQLVEPARKGKKGTHNSDKAVRWMMSSCSSKDLRAVFRGFCRALGEHPPSVRAVDDNRYINMEVAALTVYQRYDVMFLFHLWRWGSMTSIDKQMFLLLFYPDVQAAIKLRAAGCLAILRQLMRLSSGYHTSHDLANALTDFLQMLKLYQYQAETHNFVLLRKLPPRTSPYRSTVAYLTNQFEQYCAEDPATAITAVGQLIEQLHLFNLQPPTFAARILPLSRDSLEELANDKMPEKEAAFMRQYFPVYISTAIELMRKHNTTFVQQAFSGDSVIVQGTNRSVEGGMGRIKNNLKRNPKTRALLLQAMLQIREFDKHAVYRAMSAHSDRFNLYQRATRLHSAMATAESFELAYLAKHEQKAGPLEVKSIEDMTRRMMMQIAMIRLDINKDGELTTETLTNLVKHFQLEPQSVDEEELMDQAVPCVYNYISLQLQNHLIN